MFQSNIDRNNYLLCGTDFCYHLTWIQLHYIFNCMEIIHLIRKFASSQFSHQTKNIYPYIWIFHEYIHSLKKKKGKKVGPLAVACQLRAVVVAVLFLLWMSPSIWVSCMKKKSRYCTEAMSHDCLLAWQEELNIKVSQCKPHQIWTRYHIGWLVHI